MARLTRKVLEARLRKRLQMPSTKLRVGQVEGGDLAQVTFEGKDHKITVDTAQDGLIPAVIHELLHVELDGLLDSAVEYDIEEYMIAGLERSIMERMTKRQKGWWRREIGKKLQSPHADVFD